MSNILIVIEREFMTRVRKKSFIILTLLMPFLIVAMVAAPTLLGMVRSDEVTDVAVIDQTGKYAPVIFAAQKVDSTKAEGYHFISANVPLSAYQTVATNNENDNDIIVLNITDDLAKNPKAAKIYSNGEVQVDLQHYIDDLLVKKIRRDKIAAYNIPELNRAVDDLQQDFSISTVKWTKDGSESDSSADIAIALGVLTAMLIYMFVLCYGNMVMQSVSEEKTNRIVEVLVGSVRPFDLMMGKIFGVMLTGMLQIVVWGIMVVAITSVIGISMAPSMPSQDIAAVSMTAQQQAMLAAQQSPVQNILTIIGNLPIAEVAVLFVLYFIGGYLLYASFFAAIGAAINSQEDASQFQMPMIIIMIFSLYAAMGSMTNTDGPLAFWGSLFPLTSPIVMMVRLPFGVPLWQELLSIALLYATAIFTVWIASKIYRVGILSYGKKPTFHDLWTWLWF